MVELFDELIRMLRAEFGDDLQGILVTGSRIHGAPGPTSDLDVHVVIAVPRRRRRNIVLQGVEVEMFINPPFQLRRYLEQARGVDQHMFAFGCAIYDPHGVVAELQAEAREQWRNGPPPIPEARIFVRRYAPADALRDLEDVGESDPATANLLIASLVEMLVEDHYRHNRRWSEKRKRRLNHLEHWDPEAARVARTALECGPPVERRAAVERLAEHVLAPIGGLMPLTWESDWEELQPS